MSELDNLFEQPGELIDAVGGEELVIEAFRDMVKDELKRHVRETLDENPELRAEVKDAIGRYFEAKVAQAFAMVALAKAGTKVSVASLPEELQGELGEDIAQTLEQDLATVLEKGL
jgi:hypothetical protein